MLSTCAVVLVSALIGGIASSFFYAYHAPGALEVSLSREYNITPNGMGLMFSLYSIPNIVMPLLSGYAIDKFGLQVVGCTVLLTIGLGSAVYAAAPILMPDSPIHMFLFGRFLLGIGGDSIMTFSQAASNFWFAGPYEAMAMGTTLAVYQCAGSASSFYFLETIAAETSLDFANWTVVIFTCVSMVLLFVYSVCERVYADYLASTQKRTLQAYPFIICYFMKPTTGEDKSLDVDNAEEQLEQGMRVAVQAFNQLFWLENLYVYFSITILYTSANFFPEFLVEVYGMDAESAGRCTSLMYWLQALSPLCGLLSDRIGHRLHVQILCTTACIVAFLCLHYKVSDPYLLVAIIGLIFAFLEQNSLAIVARTFMRIPFPAQGTGYGIMAIFLNAGFLVVPTLVGVLATITQSYSSQCWIYIVHLVLGLLTSFLMAGIDRRQVLNLTSEEMQRELVAHSEEVDFPMCNPARNRERTDSTTCVPSDSESSC